MLMTKREKILLIAFACALCFSGAAALATRFHSAPPAPSPAALPAPPPPAASVHDPNPAPSDEEWSNMISSLNVAAAKARFEVGIYIKDLKTGRDWTLRPDEAFPAASLIKVPIMVGVFEKIREGEIGLDTKYRLHRSEKRGGSGLLRLFRSGARFSVRELLVRMITESDNTATMMFVSNLGGDYFHSQFAKMGLVRTNFVPEGLSLLTTVRNDNYTTPREMAYLMEKIYRGEMVDRVSSEIMLDILAHNKTRSRFAKALPFGWELAHKTGLLRKACHDAGIVFAPRGAYVLAVLTGSVPNYRVAKNFIAKAAKITYRCYGADDRMFAQARSRQRGFF